MKLLPLWLAITVIVLASSIGDILLSGAMKSIGDLGELRKRRGLRVVLLTVLSQGRFLLAILCLAVSFFGLLTALSWGDASLVGPASTSLTFIVSAALAKLFLNENVDSRRWISALLVCIGVVLLTM
jgi:uncharacterized membrane protein